MADVRDWLLDSDPALRWQVLADLTNASPADVAAERSLVAQEGWGGQFLALQVDGQWTDGATFPSSHWRPTSPVVGDPEAQPWVATLPALRLLRALGVDPTGSTVRAAITGVRERCRWEYNDEPYFFGSTRSSFHSTICVLEGLLQYERAEGTLAVSDARRRGEEYLLRRRLMRRATTGGVVDPEWLQFSFPTHWHYDVLRGLDYFRSAGGSPIRGWPKPRNSSVTSSSQQAGGCLRTPIRVLASASLRTVTVSRVVGTRCVG